MMMAVAAPTQKRPTFVHNIIGCGLLLSYAKMPWLVQSYTTTLAGASALLQQYQPRRLCNNSYKRGLYTPTSQRRPQLLPSYDNIDCGSYVTMIVVLACTLIHHNVGCDYCPPATVLAAAPTQQWLRLLRNNVVSSSYA